ncbi:hypothetical protein HanPSC8_Chr10g0425701 [Helianthus annuus]|nr:hypothetical protein HanPSC8_Chr10g0425701 [Helianthus annuus]
MWTAPTFSWFLTCIVNGGYPISDFCTTCTSYLCTSIPTWDFFPLLPLPKALDPFYLHLKAVAHQKQ